MLGPELLASDYVQIWELQLSARQEGPNWVESRIHTDALLLSVLTVRLCKGSASWASRIFPFNWESLALAGARGTCTSQAPGGAAEQLLAIRALTICLKAGSHPVRQSWGFFQPADLS